MKIKAKRAIVLRLQEDIVDQIDAVRHDLRMDRTAWLRKAVRAQLEYSKRKELPLVQDPVIRRALQP
jgi:metal-responsive CopG/Arc/MetJ family transcriptional regulator